jgi:hypothetical protein
VELDAALLRDRGGFPEALESFERGTSDVDWIRAAERLGQDVANPGGLDQSANGATGDDAGTRASWLQEHLGRAKLGDDLVGDRRAIEWHEDEALSSSFRRLANCVRYLVGLAQANADVALSIAHDHQGAKAEPPAAFDDFGDAVHANDFFP